MSKPEMQENLSQQDISGAEQGKQEPGLELVKGSELDSVVDVANDLAGKMETDQNVTGYDVLKLDEAMGKVKLNVGGEMMTIDEIREIPDLKNNFRIFEKFKNAFSMFEEQSYRNLTFITSEIATLVVSKIVNMNNESVHLEKLLLLPPGAAEVFSRADGANLILDGIETLSDETAERLFGNESKKRPKEISLSGLKNFSDKTARLLARSEIVRLSPEALKRVDKFI